MTPYQKFVKFYDYDADDIAEVLDECTHCYFDEDVFVCGYKTNSNYVTKKNDKMLDICDTWYVMFAAGNLIKVFDIFEKLPYLCFHRDEKYKKIKIISYERLRKLYGQKKKIINTTTTS